MTRRAAARTSTVLGALLAVSLLPACPDSAGFADNPLPAPRCTPDDNPSTWVFASVISTAPFTISLMRQTFIDGVQLTTLFAPEDATLETVQFDAPTLAASTSVVLTLTPNTDGAPVHVHSGLLCQDTPRAVDLIAQPATFTVDIVARTP